MSNSLGPHGQQPTRLLCLWNSPGENTGVGCHALLQGIFPTQGWNSGLPHCRRILYHLSHQRRDGGKSLRWPSLLLPNTKATVDNQENHRGSRKRYTERGLGSGLWELAEEPFPPFSTGLCLPQSQTRSSGAGNRVPSPFPLGTTLLSSWLWVNYPLYPCQFLPSESGGPGWGARTAAPPTKEHRPSSVHHPCICPCDPPPVPSLQEPPLLEGGRLPREEPDRPSPSSVHLGLRLGPGGTFSTSLSGGNPARLTSSGPSLPCPLPLGPSGCSRKSHVGTFWWQPVVRHVWVLPSL